jgi:hypothetical protein
LVYPSMHGLVSAKNRQTANRSKPQLDGRFKPEKNAVQGSAGRGHARGYCWLHWSLRVLRLVSEGVCGPGAMQRRVPGLTAKVLNERVRKLLRFGTIEREVFAEVPPRVEYRLTDFGARFNSLLASIEELEQDR